ncbi:MAG: type II secretion system protein [Kiritimatiellae bacterium]|nr:type II secretion system protein [Kiritimatiellia bacterium]
MKRRDKSFLIFGFTLVELLTVITIIGILAGMVGVSVTRARIFARRAKAETQLRQMIDAWLQYFQLEGEWPATLAGRSDVPMNYETLIPLIEPDPKGIVLLNVNLVKTPKEPNPPYRDPWGTAYRLTFGGNIQSQIKAQTALRTSIAFPNRQRHMPTP